MRLKNVLNSVDGALNLVHTYHSKGLQKWHVCRNRAIPNYRFLLCFSRAIVKDSIDATTDICLPPCDFLMASLGTTNYKDIGSNSQKNLTEMTFFMPSRVLQSNEQYLISFLSMASEIGGYVGLLLGVSLFHFARALSDIIEKRRQIDTVKKIIIPTSPIPKVTFVHPMYRVNA